MNSSSVYAEMHSECTSLLSKIGRLRLFTDDNFHALSEVAADVAIIAHKSQFPEIGISISHILQDISVGANSRSRKSVREDIFNEGKRNLSSYIGRLRDHILSVAKM